MGLLFNSRRYSDRFRTRIQHSKLYRALLSTAITGLLVAVGFIITQFTGLLPNNRYIVFALACVAILCMGCLLTLPWVERLEKKKLVKTSIVFLSLIGVAVILWITSAIVILCLYNVVSKGGDLEDHVGQFASSTIFLQIVVIFSLQFVVATLVGTNVLRYKKSWVVFQGVMYASYLFIDFYLTYALCMVKITASTENMIDFRQGSALLLNRYVIGILALAVVYSLLATLIINRVDYRRGHSVIQAVEDTVGDDDDDDDDDNNRSKKPESTTKEKLAELKEMLDQGLITEEEYNQKREDLLNKM